MAKNKQIPNTAIAGTGVIGASWAALYLARGLSLCGSGDDISRRLSTDDAHLCLKKGFTRGSFSETRLCTKCARIERFQFIGVSF